MKSKLLSGVLVSILALGLAACGTTKKNSSVNGDKSAEPTELETVKFGTTTGLVDHYIAIIGLEKGFFEKNGIDLQLVEFASGIETVDAATSGQVNIGKVADFAIVNRIGNTAGEFKGKLIGKFESAQNYVLYVDPDKIEKLEDLKGQSIITNPGTIQDYMVALTLEKSGITEEDVTIVNVGSGQEAIGVLGQKEAAAYWTNVSATAKVEAVGYEKLIDLTELGTTVDDYYLASNDYISSNSNTIKKFLKAVKESEEWIVENENEAVKIISEKLGVEESFVQSALGVSKLSLDFSTDTVEHLESIQSFCLEKGYYDNAYEIKEFIDTDILSDALPDAEIYE